MKQLFNLISSSKLTIILLFLFAASIGSATFIEQAYDTVTARLLVYNAKWFELILLLMVLNFSTQIFRYKMLRKEKLTVLVFHLAFIVMILGAGITRYIGYEGMMPIREGQASDIMFSSEPYFQVNAKDRSQTYHYERELFMGRLSKNNFHIRFKTADKEPVEIRYKTFIPNAVEQILENVPGGVNFAHLVIAGSSGRQNVFLAEGQTQQVGNLAFSFDAPVDSSVIRIVEKGENYMMYSPYSIQELNMNDMGSSKMIDDSVVLASPGIYRINGVLFSFAGIYQKAKKQLVSGSEDNQDGTNALIVEVDYKGNKQEIPVYETEGYQSGFQSVSLGDLDLSIAYGSKAIQLPFTIYLNDFILDRYAGSMSPSSYASEVTLIDSRNNLKEPHRIYMNHVLNYEGFRFFQSSYDRDEKGTILSVNHDRLGTIVSYLGYILLGLGFIFTLLNRNSHFYSVMSKMKKIIAERKAGLGIALVFLVSASALSAQGVHKPVSSDHAEKFGKLIVQTMDGRFEPMNTMAYDVMHKISRKDHFKVEGKGEMTDMQVFMDMMVDPDFWKKEKMIYVREKPVQDALGISSSLASFTDFFDANNNYRLANYAETAFRKKPAEQNAFDKEVIRVDERVNVFMMAINGEFLRIFPEQDSKNNKWIAWSDTAARLPISGKEAIINEDLQLPVFNYGNLFSKYMMDLFKGVADNDYKNADKDLDYFSAIQRQSSAASLIPTPTAVKLEVYYNEARIFVQLKNWYSLLAMFLLVFAFMDDLGAKRRRWLKYTLNFFIALLALAFAYHTYGLGLRWYLSGHAPWSNGYEALLLVGWGAILAGFIFSRYSKITLAATTLFAFFVLMTAGHSSYDPQLTNLQPVLKSYWLIIHVAAITISYAFLGSGFFLGLINLVLYILKNKTNFKRFDELISELTHINEILLVFGLVLATVGTFLGGVWANESWGRYWGWDAKETWALVIVLVYGALMHFRMVSGMKGMFIFNVGSVLAFSTVIMTFVGVNYYLSKGMHSYAAGESKAFPVWAWAMIAALFAFIILAYFRDKKMRELQ